MLNNKICFEQYLKVWEEQSDKLLEDALTDSVEKCIPKRIEIMLIKGGKKGKILERLQNLSDDIIKNGECKTIYDLKNILENESCIDDYEGMKERERKSLLRVISDRTKREVNERNNWLGIFQ